MRYIIQLICIIFIPVLSNAATYVTDGNITWTFSSDHTVGQFITGDWYVVGAVSITDITPGYSTSPRKINGSMINPTYPNNTHGYDNYNADAYVDALNVGASLPISLTDGQSLVSTISNSNGDIAGGLTYVKEARVLTCLASAPAAGSFRPAMTGTTKTIHTSTGLNYALLGQLDTPSGVTLPDIGTYADYLEMPWLDFGDARGRYIRPSDGIPNSYYSGVYLSDMSLMLHMSGYTNSAKEQLLINYIQLGIDLYGFTTFKSGYLVTDGSTFYGWQPDGGNSPGRKWPIIFAGIMLDYAPMKDIGQKSGDYLYSGEYGPGDPPTDYIYFGDDQLFYVTQDDIDITNGVGWIPDTDNGTPQKYDITMLNMPEWGLRHSTKPEVSDAAWHANYRIIQSNLYTWVGESMSARIMGVTTYVNQPSYFDYVDRYMAISLTGNDPFNYSVNGQASGNRPYYNTGSIPNYLAARIYDTYRLNYGPIAPHQSIRTGTMSIRAGTGNFRTR